MDLAVSVIVSTFQRPAGLALLLTALRYQTYTPFEVIAISDDRDDATQAVLACYPDARRGFCRAANISASRNAGLALAAGGIAAFIDDDAVPEPDWLNRLADAFTDPEIAAAGGFIRDRGGVKFQYRYVVSDTCGGAAPRRWRPARLAPGKFLTLTGTNLALRRDAALALGGFDEAFAYFLDETDLLCRLRNAGGKIAVVPEAEVHHARAASALRDGNGVPRGLYQIARSKAYFCAVHATGDPAARRALRQFGARKTGQIDLHLRAGRVSPEDAVRLRAELAAGIADGAALPAPARRQPITPAAAAAFTPFNAAAARRLAVIAADPAPALPWLRRLAQQGHEITLISQSGTHRVLFDGIWRHQLPARWGQTFAAAARAEIIRINARRNFDLILNGVEDVTAYIEGRFARATAQEAVPALEWFLQAFTG